MEIAALAWGNVATRSGDSNVATLSVMIEDQTSQAAQTTSSQIVDS